MSENSEVEHCQSCVLGVLSVSKWEHLWRVTVWRPIALNFASCSEEREVLNRSFLSFYVSSEVSLSWEKMLRPIRDIGLGWSAEWEVLGS